MADNPEDVIDALDQVNLYTEQTAQNIGAWSTAVDTTNDKLSDMNANILKAMAHPGLTLVSPASLRALNMARSEVKSLMSDVNNERAGSNWLYETVAESKEAFISITEAVSKSVGKASAEMKERLVDAFNAAAAGASNYDKAITSLGAIGAISGIERGMRMLQNIKFMDFSYADVQKNLMEIEKEALNMGQSFSESFQKSSEYANLFRDGLGKTMANLYATQREVQETGKALSAAFDMEEIMTAAETSTERASGAFRGFGAAMADAGVEANLINATMLTSKATGMSVADVTKILSDSHLLLGKSASEAVMSMAIMRGAAKDSGLAYDKVSDSIFSSAKTLKYYGGSVEAVTPLFKRFNESLKGIGREGLTPELLGEFVGGLEKMSFETRSLLSLASPGMAGGAGGLLGGGLKMEAALEAGDMQTVTSSLVDTLKKFSGGQGMITRQQAIENPALQRSYLIQRQLLQKITGISDAGKQDMMLRLLGDVDKHGLRGNEDAKSQLKELMSSGKQVTEQTTTDLDKMQAKRDAVFINQGEQMLGYLKIIAEKSGASDAVRAISDATKAIAGVGNINIDAIKEAFSGRTIGTKQMQELEEKASQDPKDLMRGAQLGAARAQNTMAEVSEQYKKGMSDIDAGDQKAQKRLLDEHLSTIEEKIRTLEKQKRRAPAGGQQQSVQTEIDVLKSGKEKLGKLDLAPVWEAQAAQKQAELSGTPMEDRFSQRVQRIKSPKQRRDDMLNEHFAEMMASAVAAMQPGEAMGKNKASDMLDTDRNMLRADEARRRAQQSPEPRALQSTKFEFKPADITITVKNDRGEIIEMIDTKLRIKAAGNDGT